MSNPRAQLQLPAIEPPESPRPKPSRAQLKALQYLRAGAQLVYRSWPSPAVDLEPIASELSYLIHLSTVKILIAYGWVELKSFDSKRGYYRLHETGAALADTVCDHVHREDGRIKFLPGRAVCRDCWGVLMCVSRLSPAHVATRWHWRYGAVCENHPVSSVR